MIDKLLRKNIRDLKPYSSARQEYSGEAHIFLDANESPFDTGFNRYPDPLAGKLRSAVAGWKKVLPENIFLGQGSDEAIDLLMRAFCMPGRDVVLQFTPTYGMYGVSAAINDIKVISLPLSGEFTINTEEALKAIREWCPKLIFICNPNNPSGNLQSRECIENILQNSSESIVILDEAYIDFAGDASFLPRLGKFENLVVLQTFSKAMGMAGIRLGMAFAGKEIIDVLNRIKPPYNLSVLTQEKAIDALENIHVAQQNTEVLKSERAFLEEALQKLSEVQKIFPSDANFLLVRFKNARQTKKILEQNGIIVRDRSSQVEGCLRISVGSPGQNRRLIEVLSKQDPTDHNTSTSKL